MIGKPRNFARLTPGMRPAIIPLTARGTLMLVRLLVVVLTVVGAIPVRICTCGAITILYSASQPVCPTVHRPRPNRRSPRIQHLPNTTTPTVIS